MNKREKELLRELAGDAKPQLCVRSQTRLDGGRWLRRMPVWLCVMDDSFIVLAISRRRFHAKLTFAECQATHYHHASGELIVEPSEQLQFNGFALSPRRAIQILSYLKPNAHI